MYLPIRRETLACPRLRESHQVLELEEVLELGSLFRVQFVTLLAIHELAKAFLRLVRRLELSN